MTNNIDSALKALEIINKKEWVEPITMLTDNFTGMVYHEELDDLNIEITELLWRLVDAYKADPNSPMKGMFAIMLARLTAWHYRAFHLVDSKRVYWYPLNESLSDFKTDETRFEISSSPYPSEDIIKYWAVTHCT